MMICNGYSYFWDTETSNLGDLSPTVLLNENYESNNLYVYNIFDVFIFVSLLGIKKKSYIILIINF